MLKTTIPAQQTTYVHTFVELPSDGDYHMVAAKPFRDNVHVVHHIRLLGCDEYNTDAVYLLQIIITLHESVSLIYINLIFLVFCHTRTKREKSIINHVLMFIFLIHWNNPEGYSNLTDSSGMTLFYTTKLRKHDIGTIIVGQMNINIPPRSDSVAISGTCSSECTRDKLTGPINIIFLDHHMHYLGMFFNNFALE
ncbi:hypothetical protein KUTeg_021962 [Tegillarca granosa]|uniref:Uncharacterized protein n=1 Tax=Tegillarca granosa TaxID=220873 RepID=A0ABQ9E4V8_TEGGR|nr:hypothetical protein KUTeg_021962 [Tegillarca granosa]